MKLNVSLGNVNVYSELERVVINEINEIFITFIIFEDQL